MLKRRGIAVVVAASFALFATSGVAHAGSFRSSKKDANVKKGVTVEFEGTGGACAAADWSQDPCCQSFCFKVTNRARKTLATARWFVVGTVEGGPTQYRWKGLFGQDVRSDLPVPPGKSRAWCFDGRWEGMGSCDLRPNLGIAVKDVKFE